MPSVNADGTSSGITTSATGDRHIPASVRADGSTRREIKIRPGYKPPEDIEIYKNRTAESWKTRGSGGVPGAASVEIDAEKPNGNSKNAKRREARRKAKVAEEADQSHAVGAGEQTQNVKTSASARDDEDVRQGEVLSHPESQDLDADTEREKRARNLKKKLRQAKELSEKREKGENLLPEQFEKVIKINELIRQLNSLGFDQDGEPK